MAAISSLTVSQSPQCYCSATGGHLPTGGCLVEERRCVFERRLQELMGQGTDATVAKQLPEPQSHSLAVPSRDVAEGEGKSDKGRNWSDQQREGEREGECKHNGSIVSSVHTILVNPNQTESQTAL